jgi:hypothetical protein
VSREEAARVLGIPGGTLSSRLANGRKKLAARLARRGVALSAAAIPGTLGGLARAAVPAELAARACAAAGGTPVPPAVTKLASGAFPMTTKVFLGVTLAALAAVGAVLATQADPPAPGDPPKPPPVAKADPVPGQKPDPKGAEKVAFAASPKLLHGRDSYVTDIRRVAWSPDGKLLAHQGHWSGTAKGSGVGGNTVAVDGTLLDPKGFSTRLPLPKSHNFVGFAADGKSLVTEQREYDLVSGFHRLHFISLEELPARAERPTRVVDLDADDTRGYAFAPDGKTFRTVAYELNTKGPRYRDIAVRSVDAATGKTLETLLKTEGEFQRYALSDNGKRLSRLDVKGALAVYDVDTGKSLWTKPLQGNPGRAGGMRSMQFSPDGVRLAGFGGETPYHLYDATTGEPLAKLERGEEFRDPGASSFSADGRLLAASLAKGTSGPPEYLCVWDCDTGKLLKKWDRKALVAFHPSRPLLAVLEPNGEGVTRIGLWDFAAGPEKK